MKIGMTRENWSTVWWLTKMPQTKDYECMKILRKEIEKRGIYG